MDGWGNRVHSGSEQEAGGGEGRTAGEEGGGGHWHGVAVPGRQGPCSDRAPTCWHATRWQHTPASRRGVNTWIKQDSLLREGESEPSRPAGFSSLASGHPKHGRSPTPRPGHDVRWCLVDPGHKGKSGHVGSRGSRRRITFLFLFETPCHQRTFVSHFLLWTPPPPRRSLIRRGHPLFRAIPTRAGCGFPQPKRGTPSTPARRDARQSPCTSRNGPTSRHKTLSRRGPSTLLWDRHKPKKLVSRLLALARLKFRNLEPGLMRVWAHSR